MIPGIIFTCLGAGAIYFAFSWGSPSANIALYQWGAALLTAEGIAFLVLPVLFNFLAGNSGETIHTALSIVGLVFTALGFAAAVMMLIYFSWLGGATGNMGSDYALGVGIVALILNAPIVIVILLMVCRGLFG